ncbi:hypothetical protein D3C87_1523380 [compost metagenome]
MAVVEVDLEGVAGLQGGPDLDGDGAGPGSRQDLGRDDLGGPGEDLGLTAVDRDRRVAEVKALPRDGDYLVDGALGGRDGGDREADPRVQEGLAARVVDHVLKGIAIVGDGLQHDSLQGGVDRLGQASHGPGGIVLDIRLEGAGEVGKDDGFAGLPLERERDT